mmetsp:Transcript_14535/g.30093  ORF Transcript_14535/g.30093 Transcript_14535/m.30093 type:complete len:213 (-) Transcript_14535:80-718(-)
MRPRLSEMRAVNVSRAPCRPASAPICITPTGPARFPAVCPKLDSNCPNPPAVCPTRFPNCLFAWPIASGRLAGLTRLTDATLGASRTPITPSPRLSTLGTTSSASRCFSRSISRCTSLPLLSLIAVDTSAVASSLAASSTPSIFTMMSPPLSPYLAPAPEGSAIAGTSTPGLRETLLTPEVVTVPKMAAQARIKLKITPPLMTSARWRAGRF